MKPLCIWNKMCSTAIHLVRPVAVPWKKKYGYTHIISRSFTTAIKQCTADWLLRVLLIWPGRWMILIDDKDERIFRYVIFFICSWTFKRHNEWKPWYGESHQASRERMRREVCTARGWHQVPLTMTLAHFMVVWVSNLTHKKKRMREWGKTCSL